MVLYSQKPTLHSTFTLQSSFFSSLTTLHLVYASASGDFITLSYGNHIIIVVLYVESYLTLLTFFFFKINNYKAGPHFTGPVLNSFHPNVEVTSPIQEIATETFTINNYYISNSNNNNNVIDTRLSPSSPNSTIAKAKTTAPTKSSKVAPSPSTSNVNKVATGPSTSLSGSKRKDPDGLEDRYGNRSYQSKAFDVSKRYFALQEPAEVEEIEDLEDNDYYGFE